MNRLNNKHRTVFLRCLVEGNCIRFTDRTTGATKNTVSKIFKGAGIACAEYQNEKLRNLFCERLQYNQIWSFCYSKQKNVSDQYKGIFDFGDAWTWTAICVDPSLMSSSLVGNRDSNMGTMFIKELAFCLKGMEQPQRMGERHM